MTEQQPTVSYPVEWEADVVLTDGGTARLRPITPDDRERLIEFYARVSPESKYLRFFAPYPVLSDQDVERFTTVDYVDRVALILLVRDRMLAVGRYDATGHGEAEVAFLVEDSQHGRGMGQLLLEHLAEAARERGLTRFTADVLPQNRAMVRVFVDAGYSVERAFDDGVVRVEFPISPTDKSREVMERREHRAEANSIRRLLHPTSIAVAGPGQEVTEVVRTLHSSGFRGRITAVDTDSNPVKGVPTTEHLVDLAEEGVDLVFTRMRADEMPRVVAAASEVNASAVINLVGLNEASAMVDGTDLVHDARANGMRLFGPQSLGLINTHPDVQLNGSVTRMPRPGVVGLYSQSASVGVIALSRAIANNVGVSTFLSSGSFADVTGNDVMQYWEDDENTHVCLLSLDTLGNPRKFTRIASRLAAKKPVVMFAPSHARRARHAGVTSDLPTATPAAIDRMFRQSGVLVCDRRDHMFDVAQILARQPLPKGRRVCAVTSSFALSEHIVAHLERNGLEPTEPAVVASNRIDEMMAAVTAALADEEVDSVICTMVLVDADQAREAHHQLCTLAAGSAKPLIGVFLDFTSVEELTDTPDGPGQLPTFGNYGTAVQALGRVTDYAEWQQRDHGEIIDPEGDRAAVSELVEQVLAEAPEGRRLTDAEMETVLGAWGITLVPWRAAMTVDEAIAAAEELGWSVVLKATRQGVRGRPDQTGVFRHIDTPEEMQTAWRDLGHLVADLGFGGPDDQAFAVPAVQKQVSTGVPLRIDGIEDPAFGPMVSIGVSGLPSELLDDVVWAVPPLTDRDADHLLDELRAAPLLNGYQGAPAVDRAAIVDLMTRIVDLKDRIAQISEIVITPAMATQHGLEVLGCRITVAPVGDRDAGSRELG